MKYGIREICDVVFKAKSRMTIGDKVFYKDEPVIYFDSLKTSTMEGAATTVYANGGRGNTRLIAWEGERTVTFTMEDALISTLGLSILTGANVIDASVEKPVIQHVTERQEVMANGQIELSHIPYVKNAEEDYIYVMKLDDNGDPNSEPYIYTGVSGSKLISLKNVASYTADANSPKAGDIVLIDYYTARKAKAQQMEITADKFGGNFYVEASTLFRDTNGVDMPAEFIIPNCKVQSNFTFTMASSGDPSTFTFTLDAFPDYTRWNKTKKVLSAIQVIQDSGEDDDAVLGTERKRTAAREEIETSVATTAIRAFGLEETIKVGDKTSIYVDLTPDNSTDEVTFEVASNSRSFVTVDKSGTVTGKAVGAATINVKAGDQTKAVTITVIAAD